MDYETCQQPREDTAASRVRENYGEDQPWAGSALVRGQVERDWKIFQVEVQKFGVEGVEPSLLSEILQIQHRGARGWQLPPCQ